MSASSLTTSSNLFDNPESIVSGVGDWAMHTSSTSSLAEATTAPDGSNNASKLASSGAIASWHFIRQSAGDLGITVFEPDYKEDPYTLSVYVKRGDPVNFDQGHGLVGLRPFTSGATAEIYVVWDLSTMTYTLPSSPSPTSNGDLLEVNAPPENAGNGWWRISATHRNPDFSTGMYAEISLTDDNTVGGYVSILAGEHVYLWGAQVERGFVPSKFHGTLTNQFSRVTVLD